MNQVQTLRSSVAGTRPTGRPPGELFTNWPDKQIGVIDAANQPVDLVAVRYFSVDANYAIGDFVVEAGDIWRALVSVTPAPFDPVQWVSASSAVDMSAYLPLAGGTMLGPLTLAADAAAPLQAVPYKQLAAYAEWAGGAFTGPIQGTEADFSGIVTAAGGVIAPGFVVDGPDTEDRALFGQTNGAERWAVVVGTASPETGASSGSDFRVDLTSDDGVTHYTPMSISRKTGVVTFDQAIVNGPSDQSLKTNIEPIEDALVKVNALQGVSFNMIDDESGKRQIGLIAQDVEPFVPEVIQNFVSYDENRQQKTPKLALDYPKLTALLIEAVKTLSARLEALEGGAARNVTVNTVNVQPHTGRQK